MNQRIQELADEAAKFSAIMALPTGKSGDKLFVEKFAELIVQECAKVSERTGVLNEADYEGEMIADAIREHFGVE
jgi:hypothetical protein